MHVAAPDGLTVRHRLELADPADPTGDAAIRALLRRTPMGRELAVTLEREPSAFDAARIEGPRRATLLCRGLDGEVLGMGHRSVRLHWWNGERRWLGTLSSLRRDERIAGRVSLLREGFAAMRALRRPDELPFELTSIVADNARARRLLERRLPGLPRYHPLTTLATMTFTARRGPLPRGVRRGNDEDWPAIAACLERWGERHQCAPAWPLPALDELRRAGGPEASDMLLLQEEGRIVACCAVWDQRSMRQARVHRYGSRWRAFLPLARLTARLVGRVPLPRVGEVVPFAFLALLAVDDDHPERFETLLAAARRALPGDARWLVTSLASGHPLVATATAVRSGPTLQTALSLVSDEDDAPDADGRPVHVEGAIL